MQEIDELIEAMAPSEANVLIIGESAQARRSSPTIFTAQPARWKTDGETQLRGVSPDSHRRECLVM